MSPGPRKRPVTRLVRVSLKQAKDRIRAVGGVIRATELARIMDIPMRHSRDVLKALTQRYRSVVDGDSSSRVYRFELPFKRRAVPDGLGYMLIRLPLIFLRWILRAGFGFLLAVYGLVFLLMMLGTGGNSDHALRRRIKGIFQSGQAWSELMRFAGRLNQFVMGRSLALTNPQHHLQNIYLFIAQSSGVITCADVISLTGCGYDDAHDFLSWLISVDEGEIRQTEDGDLLFVFPEFRRQGAVEERVYQWCWERSAPSWRETRVGEQNMDLLSFLSLVFFVSVLFEVTAVVQGQPSGTLRVLFADIPVVLSFAGLFFPLIRTFNEMGKATEHGANILRAEMIRILREEGIPFDLKTDVDAFLKANPAIKRPWLLRPLDAVIASIHGELVSSESNHQAVGSVRLQKEWTLAVRARDQLLAGDFPPGSLLDGDGQES